MDQTTDILRPAGEEAVEALFRAYANGFDDFDAEAIAACFRYPVTIWQSGRGNVFLDQSELLENIEALLAVFEAEEIVASDFEILDCVADETACFASLAWRQEREDGEAALEFLCRYTLVKDERGAWTIALAVND